MAEKILEPGEFLRESWPIEGTSGYDFLNAALDLLVEPKGLVELAQVYAEFTEQSTDFAAIAHEKKLGVTQEGAGQRCEPADVAVCGHLRVEPEPARTIRGRRCEGLSGSFRACFKVYRTYVVPARPEGGSSEITEEDREVIRGGGGVREGGEDGHRRRAVRFSGDVLTMEVTGRQETEFLLRFQQFTSPVMAKGVEDTAFYCYNG